MLLLRRFRLRLGLLHDFQPLQSIHSLEVVLEDRAFQDLFHHAAHGYPTPLLAVAHVAQHEPTLCRHQLTLEHAPAVHVQFARHRHEERHGETEDVAARRGAAVRVAKDLGRQEFGRGVFARHGGEGVRSDGVVVETGRRAEIRIHRLVPFDRLCSGPDRVARARS